MKKLFVLIGALLASVLPTQAIAGTPYTINWAMVSESPQCEGARLVNNGGDYFRVNQTPLPTYEVPGAWTIHENGWESNFATAGFDSVLLRMGANDFKFSVRNSTGDDSCVLSNEIATLISPQIGIEKLLFNVRREGTAFSGAAQVDLKLEEINPQLAQDIALLETELAGERKWLIEHADDIQDLDKRLDALQSLETELGDLLTRPLDGITVEDLEDMLNRYSSVIDDATRAALTQVLADMKKSLEDLQAELASLMANFGEQTDAVADFLTGEARQDGFGPDDPNNYGLGPNDVPWVDVPDISNVPSAFDADNDPYAAYADGVITSLGEYVSNGVVENRASFVALVKAWRSNQKAIEKALQARVSVSQAETAAFLNAQNKVTGYLQKFMNGSGWFHDSPVPQDVRADVDGPLKNLYGVLAEDLKEALLIWDIKTNPPEASLFFDTLRAFSAGMQAGEEIAQEYRDTMKTMVHGASRVAIGFVPFVGPAMDLCEAVTGKEFCVPSGRTLTIGERVFSGIGFGIGKVVKVWKGISSAAISTEGKATAAAIGALGDDVIKLFKERYVRKWRGGVAQGGLEYLGHGDVGNLYKFVNDYEPKALVKILEENGDNVLATNDKMVREIVGMKDKTLTGSFMSCDFITVSKSNNKLNLAEVKGFDGNGLVDVEHAVQQLRNIAKAIGLRKFPNGQSMVTELGRVQLFVPAGSLSKFKGPFTEKGGKLVISGTEKLVTLAGQDRPDLIVQVVYQ